MKEHYLSLKENYDTLFKIRSKIPSFVLKPLKVMMNLVVDIIPLQQLEYEMKRADLLDDFNFSEIGYCGHPTLTYAHIELEQATKLIISHFWEEDHPFIYDNLNNKETQ